MKKWIGAHIHETETHLREDTHVKKAIIDSTGAAGTTGQVLTTTGSVVTWTDSTFTYVKNVEGDTWVITHNLNRYPSVTVVDTGGSVIRGEIVFNTINKLTITFFSSGSASAVDGKAYLN